MKFANYFRYNEIFIILNFVITSVNCIFKAIIKLKIIKNIIK